MRVLDEPIWRARAEAHRARIDAFTSPHLERRKAGAKHPVHDFLFTYYSYRPAQLRRWHPGYGVGLAGGDEYADLRGYELGDEAARVTHTFLLDQRPLVESLHHLLTATATRPANLGCLGMHEWAMVYRLDEDQTRHADFPLRLGAAGTDDVVEAHPIACTHFDAYRFFTGPARPRNALSPGPDDRAAYEQPGCLHAGMDLYKQSFRLSPLICSDLVADCFELAGDIRVLDMRASPYDLADLGFEPVRIETPDGKREYAEAQRGFADRGAPLRDRLIAECERLLAVR